MNRDTLFSPDRKYRYTLWRHFDDLFPRDETGRFVAFVGLNPSTADETKDDNTIRRCIQFSKDWGFGVFCMLNLFAWRATDPDMMKAAQEPIGPLNDGVLMDIGTKAALVICAWGNDGEYMSRGSIVLTMLRACNVNLACLGITSKREPRHPLYLKKDLKPIPL